MPLAQSFQFDIAFHRLTSGQSRAGDPSVAGLMENSLAVEELPEISGPRSTHENDSVQMRP